MYNSPHFEETRPDELERILEEYPLGTLVYHAAEGIDAAHLPFLYKTQDGEKGKLIAHVARANDVWQKVADGSEVLIIFKGVDAYISPNSYPSKHETQRLVPTWNYQVVHVRGKIRFIDDPKVLRASVALLTHVHEAKIAEPKPWKMSDGDKELMAKMIDAIVGVEIAITQITGKSKLSQNREARDLAGAVEALRQRGEHATADAMERAYRERDGVC